MLTTLMLSVSALAGAAAAAVVVAVGVMYPTVYVDVILPVPFLRNTETTPVERPTFEQVDVVAL